MHAQIAVNPASGEEIARYDAHGPADVESALAAAATAFSAWRARPLADRAAVVARAAEVLEQRRDALADRMVAEMGKAVREARAEVDKCAWVCRYYAEHGAVQLADDVVETAFTKSYVTHQPLGPVLAVMPWNFPLWQVFRFAAPALVAGNVGLLKHARNVPGCALDIADVWREAGAPDGVFQTLLSPASAVAGMIADDRVAAVTLTGSTPAGRAVASAAGAALKKTVLELGGSDPYVVLADADVEAAAAACVTSRLVNAGQSCIAAKRFIVVDAVRGPFEAAVVRLMAAAVMGDPTAEDTDIGPMARVDLRDELAGQVARALEGGARLLHGGQVPAGPGAFFPPTVLTDVGPGNPAFSEELFGPVAAIVPARDAEHALALANDSAFGLGAAVFTADAAQGEALARTGLHAGAVFVNAFVRSDPRLPFGGIKTSGYGRELGALGIKEFVNSKTVVVA